MTKLSRREYQGSTSLTYHLTYGKASYNITMSWLSARNGYEIEAVSNCNNNCTNPEFPYRVTRSDIHKIEELCNNNNNRYEYCVICDSQLEKTSLNHNGAEWCCPTHSEEEWRNWCEQSSES